MAAPTALWQITSKTDRICPANMDGRPAKRTRQACEPCRRKKTRCPGERPACTYCLRLGHRCHYDDAEAQGSGPSNKARKMEDRMESLERKLDSLVEQLQRPVQIPTNQRPASHSSSPFLTRDVEDTRQQRISHRQPASNEEDLTFMEILECFMVYCHNQPLALFKPDTNVAAFDPPLRLAVEALGVRFPPRTFDARHRELVRSNSKRCRAMIMRNIENEQVSISSLQALCLLSMVAFSEGKVVQARLDLAIASELARSRMEVATGRDVEEFSECFQCIVMLQCLHAHVTDLPESLTSIKVTSNSSDQLDMHTTSRLLADLWRQTQGYAGRHVKRNAPPPWDAESDYMSIFLRHMELDACVPLQHRFIGSRLLDQSKEDLHARRDFFGPRLFLQFTYAGIACTLNHPLLLSMRLRDCRHIVPRTFLRQSFEQLSRNAGWIIYFIDLLEQKSFQPSDPSLAHHVVVVATIHLQHSFVEDDFLREKSKEGFEKCLLFLEKLGRYWPNVAMMVHNLKKLQESVILASSDTDPDPHSPSAWKINSHLLWNLLVATRAGQEGASVDQSIFESKSSSSDVSRQSTVAEFDLVGSVGITGHPAASSDPNPEYPPQGIQDQSTPRASSFQEPILDTLNDRDIDLHNATLEEQLWGPGVSTESHMDSLPWQVHDFGKAIDDWFDVGLPRGEI